MATVPRTGTVTVIAGTAGAIGMAIIVIAAVAPHIANVDDPTTPRTALEGIRTAAGKERAVITSVLAAGSD